MPARVLIWLHNHLNFWKIVGLLSAINGLVCFALSSTFIKLFGEWDFLRLLLYLSIFLIIICFVLLAKRIRIRETPLEVFMTCFGFLSICVYNVAHDKTGSGPDALSTISYLSFALMSLSMSRKFELGFETGFFLFFLEFFCVQLMKISWILTPIAAAISVPLIIVRWYSGYHQPDIGPTREEDHLTVRISDANREGIETDDGDINGVDTTNQDNVTSGINMAKIRNGSMHSFPVPESSTRLNLRLRVLTNNGSFASDPSGAVARRRLSQYDLQMQRDWNKFLQYLRYHKTSLTLARCNGAHVIEYLKYINQFGKTKVHITGCPYLRHPNPSTPCACPLKQEWSNLEALTRRLREAYEENGGQQGSNPFSEKGVRIYMREVRERQAKARRILYERKKQKNTTVATTMVGANASAATTSGGDAVVASRDE